MVSIPFQTAIGLDKAYAVEGDLADCNRHDYYPITPLVDESAGESGGVPVQVGRFIWINNETQTCTAVGTGVPTAIVQRVVDKPMFVWDAGASMIVPPNYPITPLVYGAVFIRTSDVPVLGNVLFVNNTTGVITNAAAGGTVSGATETKWKIVNLGGNAAAANNIVMVTNREPKE